MSTKSYRDMTTDERAAWGRAELAARKLDLAADTTMAGLEKTKANATRRRKEIGATFGQASDLVVQASREARRNR